MEGCFAFALTFATGCIVWCLGWLVVIAFVFDWRIMVVYYFIVIVLLCSYYFLCCLFVVLCLFELFWLFISSVLFECVSSRFTLACVFVYCLYLCFMFLFCCFLIGLFLLSIGYCLVMVVFRLDFVVVLVLCFEVKLVVGIVGDFDWLLCVVYFGCFLCLNVYRFMAFCLWCVLLMVLRIVCFIWFWLL